MADEEREAFIATKRAENYGTSNIMAEK